MKLAKVFLPAIALMTMAFATAPVQSAEKVKIGVAMALFDDVWLTHVRDAMTKWASTHPDVELTIVDAANDTAKQVGQVENFLAQGVDAVVILPVDTAATGPMTKAVVKAGKPLVYVNREPANLPKGRSLFRFQVHRSRNHEHGGAWESHGRQGKSGHPDG